MGVRSKVRNGGCAMVAARVATETVAVEAAGGTGRVRPACPARHSGRGGRAREKLDGRLAGIFLRQVPSFQIIHITSYLVKKLLESQDLLAVLSHWWKDI